MQHIQYNTYIAHDTAYTVKSCIAIRYAACHIDNMLYIRVYLTMQLSSYNVLVKDLKLHMLWGILHVHEPYFDLRPWMGATLDWDFPSDLFQL